MRTVGISLYDGLKPATPQKAAGRMTEPPVCVPNAMGSMPAATAAAEPEDEPPGVYAGFTGLRVFAGFMWANSVDAVLPSTSPPARRTMQTAAASAAGRWPR